MVASISVMSCVTRSRASSGRSWRRLNTCSETPLANSRCTTRSCRSRAMRSRSRKTKSFCSASRATSRVSDTAAWTAIPSTAANRSGLTACSGSVQTSTRVPTLLASVVTGKQPTRAACGPAPASTRTSVSITRLTPSRHAARASGVSSAACPWIATHIASASARLRSAPLSNTSTSIWSSWGLARIAMSARATSRARCTSICRTIPPSSSRSTELAISAAAACHCPPTCAASNSCALRMATPAARASDRTRRSSSASKPPGFSVRYRLPNTASPARIGTPRKLSIGGCPGGKPVAESCCERCASRSGWGWRMSSPSTPRPCGRLPTAAACCADMPLYRNWLSPSSGPKTPKAPYCAPVSSVAASRILVKVVARSRPSATSTRAWANRSSNAMVTAQR